MVPQFETIRFSTGGGFAQLPAESRDVIVVSTKFTPGVKASVHPAGAISLTDSSERLLTDCGRLLRANGLLWVYGPPRELAVWGDRLSQLRGEGWQLLFKYWFALDLDDAPRRETLKPSHLGLVLFIKARVAKRVTATLALDTDTARTAHRNCAACGNTLKDWGGKKHLMNPKGAAPSDVWRDLPRRKLRDSVIPSDVLARVAAMSLTDGRKGLHVIQTGGPGTTSASSSPAPRDRSESVLGAPAAIEADSVHHEDCVSFLNRVAEFHPDGLFDLAFADPPYNLAKNYGGYDDERADAHYLSWCNEWLGGMARALKPGGSLLVLNLPKWATHHATFLSGCLEFRHWIVWDALSDPRGKIMPAHYALLWFTKPGGKVVCNYDPGQRVGVAAGPPSEKVPSPDSPHYCLRAACVRERKARSNDEKVELTDVWFDVHRIRHKRDRDAHPCQLPDKLMERIIKLTTHRGGWVFDPFGGAGTTAIVAAKLARRFVLTEMDGNYVRISREKLAAMKQHANLFGELVVPRVATVKTRPDISKREVELYLQDLARRLGRVPNEEDVASDNAAMLAKMDAIYPSRAAALKRAKVALAGRT